MLSVIAATTPAATTITIGGVTLGSILSLLGAIAGAIAAIFGYLNRKNLNKVHVTVNGNLEKAVGALRTEVDRTQQLHNTLVETGVPVPPRRDGASDAGAS
jgi:uncharacterized membrane protein YdjX (TVP38/TMEM64 family)